MKKTDSENFHKSLSKFFNEYLGCERGVSPNTIRSYSHTFVLFLDYMRSKGVKAECITNNHITRNNILCFLDWIQNEKGNSDATRNQRLAAIHAYCRFMQYEDVVNINQWQECLSIKIKKTCKKSVNYLTVEGIKLLLAQIPLNTSQGRRDLAMLSLLYESGARVQELVDLSPKDLRLEAPATVTLFGKGKKKRIVPLQTQQVNILREYLAENGLDQLRANCRPLFQNNRGGRLTTAGVTHILKRYAVTARAIDPDLIPECSPHSLRHSKAMHLLQAGVNLVYIRDLLGHVSIQTTEVYARADSKQKREALEAAYTNVIPDNDISPSWEKDAELRTWLKSLCK